MGQNLRYLRDYHLFKRLFKGHQGYRALTHSHISSMSMSVCLCLFFVFYVSSSTSFFLLLLLLLLLRPSSLVFSVVVLCPSMSTYVDLCARIFHVLYVVRSMQYLRHKGWTKGRYFGFHKVMVGKPPNKIDCIFSNKNMF